MEQTQQDKEILQENRIADKTVSENIVEMLNLLYGNLLKAMRSASEVTLPPQVPQSQPPLDMSLLPE